MIRSAENPILVGVSTPAPAGHFNIADRYMPSGWYQTTNRDVAETAARAGQYVTFTDATGATTEFVVEEA